MCGGWGVRLCVQLHGVQGHIVREQAFLWVWIILNPRVEHTVGLRTMCRVGLVKDLCFCGSGSVRECVYERERERERVMREAETFDLKVCKRPQSPGSV